MASTATQFDQPWRFVYRLPLLAMHLLVGLPLVLLAFLPGIREIPAGRHNLQVQAHRFWCLQMLRIFGVRLIRSGHPLPRGPALVVANHISWIDILVIHSVYPARFVAKAEIARWPLIGVLAGIAGTIYIRRGDAGSRARVTRRIAACLRRGEKVTVFPEGGIKPEPGVGRFHGRLFAAAIRTGVPAVPVALKYAREVDLHNRVVFGPGQSFITNLLGILSLSPFQGHVRIGRAESTVAARRNEVARRTRAVVREMYDF